VFQREVEEKRISKEREIDRREGLESQVFRNRVN
jgi:hypothetical protein